MSSSDLHTQTGEIGVVENNRESKSIGIQSKTLPQVGSIVCRICYSNDHVDRFISPCLCKGSLGFVHLRCLERWLSCSGLLHCELCMFKYNTKCTLKYTCCQALRLWYRNPIHRTRLRADCVIYLLLTAVTFFLASMSLLGMLYFKQQRNISTGFSNTWMNGFFVVFCLFFLVAYIVNTSLVFRFEFFSWYRWWHSMRHVRLILPEPKDHADQKEISIQDVPLGNNSQHLEILIE